jgi:hypothetical protein
MAFPLLAIYPGEPQASFGCYTANIVLLVADANGRGSCSCIAEFKIADEAPEG